MKRKEKRTCVTTSLNPAELHALRHEAGKTDIFPAALLRNIVRDRFAKEIHEFNVAMAQKASKRNGGEQK